MRSRVWGCTEKHNNTRVCLQIVAELQAAAVSPGQYSGPLEFVVRESFAESSKNSVSILRQLSYGRVLRQERPIPSSAETYAELEDGLINFRHGSGLP